MTPRRARDELLAPVDARDEADHAALVVDDQRLHQRVGLHPRRRPLDGGDQALHEDGARLDARVLHRVAARRRARDLRDTGYASSLPE